MLSKIKVPEGWKFGNFSDFYEINPRVLLDRSKNYDFIEMAAVEASDRSPHYYLQVKGNKNGSKFQQKDVIFARITPCTENGKVSIITSLPNSNFGIGSTEFIVLRKKENISDENYLYYFVSWNKIKSFAVSRMRGTSGRQRVPNDVFKFELTMILPPLPEQEKIAAILSSVDNAIQATNKVIHKTKKLKKGLMQQLLTKGIGHTEFKKVKVGYNMVEIPDNWIFSTIGNTSSKGKYGANASSEEYDKDKPRYVRITDILDTGFLIKDKIRSIILDGNEEFLLTEGDIIFARSGATVGKTYLYNKKDGICIYAGYCIRFRPISNLLLPNYLFYVTKSGFYYSWLKSMMKVGAQPNINEKEFSSFKFPLPPLPEQEKIAAILSSVDKLILNYNINLSKLNLLKKSLMQQLLTGKIRVKVN